MTYNTVERDRNDMTNNESKISVNNSEHRV
jgi:hypothetical protein